ncbi:MAG: hypothetical protein ACJA1C_001279 [Crocinitomicaceae bacterium]|jgi:hypothetical protein
MKQILLVFLLSVGSCFSQDSIIYKAAIFDSNDSSLVAYIFAPAAYVVSKEQLVTSFDPKAQDSLVELQFDHHKAPALLLYHEYGLTGVSIYLNQKEQQAFLIKSEFQYHIFRAFQAHDFFFENEWLGVTILSLKEDEVITPGYNARVEKILMIRNWGRPMEGPDLIKD